MGLEKEAPRPSHTPKITPKQIRAVVGATLHTTPSNTIHWSTRNMAKAKEFSLGYDPTNMETAQPETPFFIRNFKLSRDKRFVEKLYDAVGLYLNPLDRSLVWCVDEKSQTQTLDRVQPGLPIKKRRCETITHDYKRNGTTILFAALSTFDGEVIRDCVPRHWHQEFIRFLKRIDGKAPSGTDLRLILDYYSTYKHTRVKSWLNRHPRFHLHFIPTSSSWLNLVERRFREITVKHIR